MGHRAWYNVVFPHVQRAWSARGAVSFRLFAWRMRLASVHCKLRLVVPVKPYLVSKKVIFLSKKAVYQDKSLTLCMSIQA